MLRINSTCAVARAQEAVASGPVLQPSAKSSAEGAKRAPGWPTLPPSQDFRGWKQRLTEKVVQDEPVENVLLQAADHNVLREELGVDPFHQHLPAPRDS